MIIRAVYTHNVHFSGAGCQHAAQTSPSTLRRVSEPLMIVRMTTASRPQRRYDHRLRDLVQRTRDVTIATDLGVPRSTARGWLDAAPRVVIGLEVADLTEPELRQEIRKLQRRVEKLAALLRLALALLHASGFRLSGERLPDGPAKRRILRAVDRARGCSRCGEVRGHDYGSSRVHTVLPLAPRLKPTRRQTRKRSKLRF